MNDADELNGFKLTPRRQSTLSTHIAENYRLSDFSITPMRGGTSSTVARIADDTNGPRVVYCLKSHAPGKNAAQIEAQHAVIGKLRSTGFHLTPTAIRTVSGATLFQSEDSLWSMYDYVESLPALDWTICTWGEIESAAGGETLALLHAASAKMKVMSTGGKLDIPEACILDRSESWLTAALSKLSGNTGSGFSLRDSLSAALVECLREVVDKLRAESPNQQGQSQPILLHGDYHPANLLFSRPDRVVGVVDYEDLHLGARVQDIAYGALTFALATERETAAASEDTAVNEQRLQGFLKAYEREWKRKGTGAAYDHQTLALWIRLSAFLIIYWCLERIAESRDNVAIFRRPLELAVRVATGTCAATGQLLTSAGQ